jgi:hypothetical protein
MENSIVDSISFFIIDAISTLPGFQTGYYRILTTLQDIKYLAFSPSHIGTTLPDIRGDWLGFTIVPVGNWNVGYLGKNAETSKLDLQYVGRVPIQRVEDIWYPTWVDISVLGEPTAGYPELQCTGQMYSAIYWTQSNASSIVVNTE